MLSAPLPIFMHSEPGEWCYVRYSCTAFCRWVFTQSEETPEDSDRLAFLGDRREHSLGPLPYCRSCFVQL